MIADGLVRHHQAAGDRRVVPAPGQEIEDFTFPEGEPRERSGPRPWTTAAAKNPTTRSAIFGPNTASPRATERTALVMSSELDSLSR